MKNWIQKHMIAIWALCSVLFAIIIHLLFHWETDIEILHAKWSAGDILTYASTVALGLLALWQNKRFKEENDAAQERLERLSAQANEISLINKIVELESDRLSRLRIALDEFTDACNPTTLVKIFLSENNAIADELGATANNVNAGTHIDNCFRALLREVPTNTSSNKSFTETLTAFHQDAGEFLEQAIEKPMPDDNCLKQLRISFQAFDAEKEILLKEETQKLNRVIYETLPVSEIKKMYYDTLPEEEEDS